MIDNDTALAILDATDRRRAERRRFLTLATQRRRHDRRARPAQRLRREEAATARPTPTPTPTPTATSTSAQVDVDILNFALNLEYLEAQFYLYAVYGTGLPGSQTSGTGTMGTVTGGRAVAFTDPRGRAICPRDRAGRGGARQLPAHRARQRGGGDAQHQHRWQRDRRVHRGGAGGGRDRSGRHVRSLCSRTRISCSARSSSRMSGSARTRARRRSSPTRPICPRRRASWRRRRIMRASSAPCSTPRASPPRRLRTNAGKISDARDSLDGTSDDDQGITGDATTSNIVPADGNGIAYSRTTGQVLNIAYLSKAAVSQGGFFPNGVNGNIKTRRRSRKRRRQTEIGPRETSRAAFSLPGERPTTGPSPGSHVAERQA